MTLRLSCAIVITWSASVIEFALRKLSGLYYFCNLFSSGAILDEKKSLLANFLSFLSKVLFIRMTG